MMHEPNDPDPVDQILSEHLSDEAPEEVHAAAGHHFYLARRTLRALRKSPKLPGGLTTILRVGWAAAGAGGALLVVLLVLFLASRKALAWNDVVKRFAEVKYFSATIFITDKTDEPPEKMELWLSGDGRARLHHRGRVFFARDGKVLRIIDPSSGKGDTIDDMNAAQLEEAGFEEPIAMLRILGTMETLSLDTLLSTFSGELLRSPPLPNADASIGEDLEVFDATNDRTPEWLRIWVLKTSRLPLRLRIWDPRRGTSVEVLFEYMDEQPAEAFDPEAFGVALRKRNGSASNLYSLLKDPGDQELSPADLFAKTGYHMPELAEIGRTTDGIVWVKSREAINRMPDGRLFYGFGKLEDDLDQEYIHKWVGGGDHAHEYFVPLEYRHNYRKPSSYTLTCWSQPDHWSQPADVVGSIEVNEWQEDAPIPDSFGQGARGSYPLRAVIDQLRRREDWAGVERLLELIPGKPETSNEAFYRERTRLTMLREQLKYDDALVLSSQLYPIVREKLTPEKYWHGWPAETVRDHIVLLVRANRKEDAAALCAYHIPILRRWNRKSNNSKIDVYADFVGGLWRSLQSDEAEEILGVDVRKDKRVRAYLDQFGKWDRPTVDKDPRFEPWRKYVRGIAKLYDKRPLPDEMEFLTDVKPFGDSPYVYTMALPGHDEYCVTPVRGLAQDKLREITYQRDMDPTMVEAPPELAKTKFNTVAVFRKDIVSNDTVVPRIFAEFGWEVYEKPVTRRVWVARYDGRKLPSWVTVRPMEQPAGAQPAQRGGGSRHTARSLLRVFSQTINYRDGAYLPDPIIIVDDTGLPTEPGPGQSWGNVALTREYAFYQGEAAIEPTKQWFEENFGITFHEEEREIKVLSLRPIPARVDTP